jgi:PAS domain S-box-containing protein
MRNLTSWAVIHRLYSYNRAMSTSPSAAFRLAPAPDLQVLVDSIPSLVHTGQPDGHLDFFNQSWLTYAGCSLEELQGWKWTAAIHPDDVEGLVHKWQASLASGEPLVHEARIRRHDGEYRWMLHHMVARRDENGKIIKWHGSSIDVDDYKRRESYLAEGQRLAHTGSWAFDAAGFNYWSPEMFRIHGFDEVQKAPTIQEYLDRVHTEDREFMLNLIEGILAEPSRFDATKRIVRPDGEVRYVRCVGGPVSENPEAKKFVGSTIDVTEHELLTQELHRRAEEFQQVVDLVPQVIVVLAPNGDYIYANRVAQEYTGVILDKYGAIDLISRVVHPDDAPRMRAERARGLKGSVPFEIDVRLLGKDGVHRWFLFRYNPWIEEGSVKKWFGTATEIQSRKQEEERVRKENVRLEERTRIAQELHDTLLQSFLSASLQLRMTVDTAVSDSQVKQRLDRIVQIMNEGIAEGRNTIKDLRSTDSEKLDLVMSLSQIRHEFEMATQIEFRVNVAGVQKPVSLPIRREIYRIGREALINAFSHSGANRIEVQLEYADTSLRMRITDNGRGIDPRVLRSGREGHWGLTGMRERATKIGGTLEISSSAPSGTELQLSIPNDIAFEDRPQKGTKTQKPHGT